MFEAGHDGGQLFLRPFPPNVQGAGALNVVSECLQSVIPTQAGIHSLPNLWMPAFAGMTVGDEKFF